MINALKPHFREFLRGWLKTKEGRQLWFKYAIVTDEEKQLNTPLKNLISSQGNMAFQTSWDLPFVPNETVCLNGTFYKILRAGKVVSQINEQSLGLLKENFNAYWVVEVTR